ncbi:LytR C-terminal domain-containing protein [Lacisediminimonas profundi]|uniref:LytR C-terminal domain-containing protein n=1 Tax=Lacisediminimonas profundi TaxID=2603856 RepID=UPI00124B088B|nr:LytR C-terminal domain-containing protein [Lacisediminimonas profundi]
MKSIKPSLALPLACALPLLFGCATPPNRSAEGPRIEPLWRTSNTNGAAAGFLELGRYYQGQNRLDLAATAYQRALEADREFVEARSALGTLYSQRGQYDAAAREFEAALAIAPRLAWLYNNLGYTRFLQQRYADAAASYQKALELEPGNPRTLNNLGAAYAEQGLGDQAKLAFEQARSGTRAAVVAEVPAARPVAASRPAAPHVAAGAATIDISTPYAPVALGGSLGMAPSSSSIPAPLVQVLPESGSGAKVGAGTERVTAAPAPEPATAAAASSQAVAANEQPLALAKHVRLEISNGNGSTGLAAKVNRLLIADGLPKARLSNAAPYRQQETVIQYRAGFEQQARTLGRRFSSALTVVDSRALRTGVDVRLLIGKDATGSGGWYEVVSNTPNTQQKSVRQAEAGQSGHRSDLSKRL